MNTKQQRAAVERGAEMLAALTLGGAVAFGMFHAAPLAGLALMGAMALASAAAAFGGLALLGRVDRKRGREGYMPFEPGDFIDGATEDEDELLLDDAIAPLGLESRVIQLFEPNQPDPLPEPGELVARIADYLDSGRGAARPDGQPIRNDASAALHAALADIRRSLR